MLVFAAINGFVFVVGRIRRACAKRYARRQRNGTDPHRAGISGIPHQPSALAVAMQRRVSLWFYWSGALLAFGTVFSGSLYCWRCRT